MDDNRTKQHQVIGETLKNAKLLAKLKPQAANTKLIQYTTDGIVLDFLKYELIIHHILSKVPFFNRFARKDLMKVMVGAEVEKFKDNELVFLKDRVGIITYGSIMVKSHEQDIMKPNVIGRFRAGSIIGGGRIDGNITVNSHTWFSCYDDETEIIFISVEAFELLWRMQIMQSDFKVLISYLRSNSLLKDLTSQSIHTLVYDKLQILKFKPGQCIFRMAKDSVLNTHKFGELYEDGLNSFKAFMEKDSIERAIKRNISKREVFRQESFLGNMFKQLNKTTNVNPNKLKTVQEMQIGLSQSNE